MNTHNNTGAGPENAASPAFSITLEAPYAHPKLVLQAMLSLDSLDTINPSGIRTSGIRMGSGDALHRWFACHPREQV